MDEEKPQEVAPWNVDDVPVVAALGCGMLATSHVDIGPEGQIGLGIWVVDHGLAPGPLPQGWTLPVRTAPTILFIPQWGPAGVMGCHSIARALLLLADAICRATAQPEDGE